MRNLREDPITINEDLILEEGILSPPDDILNRTKTNAWEDVQGMHFRKPADEQSSHLQQDSSPRPKTKTLAPKPISKNKQQRHVREQKLSDLHPKDPTTVQHRYPTRNHIAKSGQTVTYSNDTLSIGADNLANSNNNDDDNDDDENLILPTGPTTPSVEH
jgi:hypothetical protein